MNALSFAPQFAQVQPAASVRAEREDSDHSYFLRRMHAAVAMARAAASSTARLIHFDLAGRYSVMAARARAGTRP